MKHIKYFNSLSAAKQATLYSPILVNVTEGGISKLLIAQDGNKELRIKQFVTDLEHLTAENLEEVPCTCATMIYGSKRPDLYPFIDLEEYYTYSGEVTIENEVYYKWLKQGDVNPDTEEPNIYILTTTRDFSSYGFSNPYIIDGYYAVDETGYEYPDSSFHIYYGGTHAPSKIFEIEHRDTSILNANNVEYVDLGLHSGALWATMNINANTDNVNGYYGKYFQWGDTEGYMADESHDFSWSTYKYGDPWNEDPTKRLTKYNTNEEYGAVDNKTELELSDDAARVNLGGDWHMPNTKLLCELLLCTKKNEWVENYNNMQGLNGRLFTGNNGNTLFIPASGIRYGSDIYSGYNFYLWSSILYSAVPYGADYLCADAGSIYINNCVRYNGFAVRGVLY